MWPGAAHPAEEVPTDSTSQQLTTGALVRPVITGAWQTLFDPVQPGPEHYMNDHTVFKAPNNNWYVNAFAGGFLPGDRILFKAGDQWGDGITPAQLHPPGTGDP